MAAEKSSETNWRTRRVATMMTIITTTGRDYSIWPMRESEYDRDIESNIIPTSQLSAISSQRSYNGRDALPQWRRLSRVQDSTLPTREIEYHSYKSMERDHQWENLQSMAWAYPWIGNTENRKTIASQRIVYTYSSSNLEEARRTAKTTKEIGSLRLAAIRNATSDHSSPNLRKALPPIPIIPTIPIPGIQNPSSPISTVEAAMPTIISAVALKRSLRKPKGKPAMHSLRQRRPQNLIGNLGWDTTAPNRLKIKSHSGMSGSDVKSISMWHRETWFGAYHPWSPCMKYTRQQAASQSTNRLRCNEHLYIAEPT